MTRLSTINSSWAMRITLLPPNDVPPLTTPKRVPTMLGGSPWMPRVNTLRAAGWLEAGFAAPGAESGRVAQALRMKTAIANARNARVGIDPPDVARILCQAHLAVNGVQSWVLWLLRCPSHDVMR